MHDQSFQLRYWVRGLVISSIATAVATAGMMPATATTAVQATAGSSATGAPGAVSFEVPVKLTKRGAVSPVGKKIARGVSQAAGWLSGTRSVVVTTNVKVIKPRRQPRGDVGPAGWVRQLRVAKKVAKARAEQGAKAYHSAKFPGIAQVKVRVITKRAKVSGVRVRIGGTSARIASSGVVTPSNAYSAARASAVTCAQGGPCSVGDVGPGGGTVFYAAPAAQSWGQYLEAAPAGWSGSTDPLVKSGCAEVEVPGLGNEIGRGAANTDLLVAAGCENAADAASRARAYTGGGVQWSLPATGELNQLCRYARQQDASSLEPCSTAGSLRSGFTGDQYWSSSQLSSFGSHNLLAQSFISGDLTTGGVFSEWPLRPTRAFKQTYTPNPTPCEQATVGGLGPGGGTVFYKNPGAEPHCLEAAPKGWARAINPQLPDSDPLIPWGCYEVSVRAASGVRIGDGPANTQAIVDAAPRCVSIPGGYKREAANLSLAALAASSYAVPGKPGGWFLPSRAELDLLNHAVANGTVPAHQSWDSSWGLGAIFWSSTQDTEFSPEMFAFMQALNHGGIAADYKDSAVSVWPIRAFS